MPDTLTHQHEERRKASLARGMTVRAGGQDYPVLRRWDSGFAMAPAEAPGLRGLVDLYDGTRHVCQALVLTAREEAGERVFEFKYATPARDTAPSPDCVAEEAPAPRALPRPDLRLLPRIRIRAGTGAEPA